MSHRVVDLTEEVVTVRRLRAAATLPRFIALCCFIGTVIAVSLAATNWVLWTTWRSAQVSFSCLRVLLSVVSYGLCGCSLLWLVC